MTEAMHILHNSITEFNKELAKWLDIQMEFKKEGTENHRVNSVIENYKERIDNLYEAINILKENSPCRKATHK